MFLNKVLFEKYKMPEEKLVFAYAYMINNGLGLPKGLPGFFVGNQDAPIKGNFEGRNNLKYAAIHASRKSRELSTLVDMNFEGLARDDGMTLLLQPIQEYRANYKSVNELMKKYLPDSTESVDPDGWYKHTTILIR